MALIGHRGFALGKDTLASEDVVLCFFFSFTANVKEKFQVEPVLDRVAM
jgi:hypothetical protein